MRSLEEWAKEAAGGRSLRSLALSATEFVPPRESPRAIPRSGWADGLAGARRYDTGDETQGPSVTGWPATMATNANS